VACRAGISLASLLTALAAYRVNQTALMQVQRAYLTVVCESNQDKDFPAYRVIVRNLGNTPALHTVIHAVAFKYYEAERTKSFETLGPKEDRLLVKVALRAEVFASENVAFRGELNYQDIFGLEHKDVFCFQALAGETYICDDSGGTGSFHSGSNSSKTP
jgi:hypothetical protein